ncbi:pyridoxal phosphate-dependent aminotransferase [Methanohalophilus sp.]|uniref:pyridoxal phosphate-dependent aminotransferase n=1 Tax=Methanohalophilus sp. TaxID=1966352 RepID=UPI00262774F6|nr:pyridoxal phosphate-dependent aminotransferase [Methanohalophilus sp.]MDK2892968.1 aspartate aminotransferase [Methanohalophilus sp.]
MVSTFAERVQEIDISGIRKMFEGAGPNAINLGIGQPDFDTPEHIKKAAIQAIEEGFTGYTAGPGIPELREALSHKFWEENSIEVSPDNIIVTSGASEALELALGAFVNTGDEVLIADPGFVSYKALTEIMGGYITGIPLNEKLCMDPETVNEMISPNTKALIINSPANPTGAVQSKSDMKAFAEIADDNNIMLISDEVYEHFIYEGEHVSPAIYSDNVITVNAVSKTYSMTGWRLGYVAASPEITQQMLKIHQYVQACATSISQKAALAAIEGPMDPIMEMKEEFRKRRDLLLWGLGKLGMKCTKPDGAFYAFPEAESGTAEKLISEGVIVVPGEAFGENGSGHIRISYATSKENIKKALAIMQEVLL